MDSRLRSDLGKNGATVAGYNNVLTLSPPLNIEESDIELLLATITYALDSIK